MGFERPISFPFGPLPWSLVGNSGLCPVFWTQQQTTDQLPAELNTCRHPHPHRRRLRAAQGIGSRRHAPRPTAGRQTSTRCQAHVYRYITTDTRASLQPERPWSLITLGEPFGRWLNGWARRGSIGTTLRSRRNLPSFCPSESLHSPSPPSFCRFFCLFLFFEIDIILIPGSGAIQKYVLRNF